jgi:hypothetical protein
MRTLASSVAFLLLAACLSGCGKETSSETIRTLLPAENALPGWVFDTTYPIQPVIKTNSELGVGYPDPGKTGGINGSATPFVQHNFSEFLQGYYSNGNFKVKIWLFQMPDVATSVSLFNDIIVDDSVHKSYNWGAANVGDAGRVAFTGTTAVLNARKSLFYFEIELKPDGGSDIPETTKQIVIDFGNAIASKVK